MVVAQQLVAFCIIHPNPVLQEMLHIVHLTASELLLEFNVDESYGIVPLDQMLAIFLLCVLGINPSIGVVQSNI